MIEFPDLEGAEAWIEGEVAPPYGLHGLYEYHLARRLEPGPFRDVLEGPGRVIEPQPADPATIPALGADRSSVVVLQFSRTVTAGDGHGEAEHIAELRRVAGEHRILHLGGFALIDPVEAWHRVWLCEFPNLAGAEAWIEAEAAPPSAAYAERSSYLARRWAPTYFAA